MQLQFPETCGDSLQMSFSHLAVDAGSQTHLCPPLRPAFEYALRGRAGSYCVVATKASLRAGFPVLRQSPAGWVSYRTQPRLGALFSPTPESSQPQCTAAVDGEATQAESLTAPDLPHRPRLAARPADKFLARQRESAPRVDHAPRNCIRPEEPKADESRGPNVIHPSGLFPGERRCEQIDCIHHRDTEAQRKHPLCAVLSASVSLW